MEGIVVRDVVKCFDDVQALRGVSLEVGTGEVVALLGENGAGKSTLIRILATTLLPDTGTTTVLGHDVSRAAAKVRALTGVMLGNERSWYWRLSGRRNLEFFAALYGLRRREAASRTRDLLEQVGLAGAADRRFEGYSAGMRARLSLARSLLREPPILLLDEPTQALDPVAAASFRELVLRLSRERGTSTLLATHNLHEAATVASHVVVLAHGAVASTASGADAAYLEEALLTAVAA